MKHNFWKMVDFHWVSWLLILSISPLTDASEFQIFEEARLANTPLCPDPVPVANAYRWSVDESVEYGCPLGFQMTKGNDSLACLGNGSWSGQPPTCELTCGQPPIALGANMSGVTTVSSGMKYAMYSCLPSVNSTYPTIDMYPCLEDVGFWMNPVTHCIYPYGFHTNLTSWVYNQSAYNATWADQSFRTTAGLARVEDLDLTCLRQDIVATAGANGTNSTETEFSMNNITRLFEFSYIELGLETVDTDTECVEATSNSTSVFYGVNYMGLANATASGLPCLSWQDVATNNQTAINLTSAWFPDGNLSDASNYCRNPLRSGSYRERPWCFTWNSTFAWEYCSIRECSRFTVVVKVTSNNNLNSQTCGQTRFYRAQADSKFQIVCPTSPTAPFGTNLRITVNSPLARSLYICDVVGHGVDYENMCGEPHHQRGWNLTTPLSYHEGTEAVYVCAKGYHHLQGDGLIRCLGTRLWSSHTLVCSDEPNHAYTNRTTLEPIQDNDSNTCAMPSSNNTVDVILDYTVEVRQVAVMFAGERPKNVTVTADSLGRFTRLCRSVKETSYGYLFTCVSYPITERLVVTYGPDENTTLCEVKVFGRKYTGVLECRQTENGVDYKGHQNISRYGFECAPWASFNPTDFQDYEFPDGNLGDIKNYCRNPIRKSTSAPHNNYRPICYYRIPPNIIGWDYCDLFLCERGCRMSKSGREYTGKIDQAVKNGTASTPCAVWNSGSSDFKIKPDFSDNGSPSSRYCRNPGESQERPWCYTNTATLAYAYCDVPICPTIENTDQVNLNLNSTNDQMTLKNYTVQFRECLLTEFNQASYFPPIYNTIMYQLCYNNPGQHRDLLCHYKSASGVPSYGDNASWMRVNIRCPPYKPTTTVAAPTSFTSSTTRASTLVHTTTHALKSTTDNETTNPNVCPLTCTVRCIQNTNYTNEIKVYQEKIRQELLVNTNNLSKTVRLKSSAPDARPSAKVTAGVAIAVMVVVVIFLLSGDAISLSHYIYLKFKGKPFKP